MGSSEKHIHGSNQVLDAEEIQILRNTLWKHFTEHEVDYCVKIAKALRLSPILKQIHFLRNEDKNGKVSITNITSIDGLRLSAQRTGEYAGSDDAIFEYDTSGRSIKKATVSIYRIVNGMKCTFTASARWEEYFPGGNKAFMWNKMPHVMISKCAEAQALRKGFPAELSSLYVDAEMDQAQSVEDTTHPVPNQSVSIQPKQGAIGSGAFCEACDVQLVLSKVGKGYYCPRWNDGDKNGKPHTRFPVSKLEEFKKYQKAQEKVDEIEPIDLDEDHDDLIHD